MLFQLINTEKSTDNYIKYSNSIIWTKKGGCFFKQPPNFIFGQKFSVSDVVGI